MKDNFYVFLDIDGVLNNQDFLLSYRSNNRKGSYILDFAKHSVDALNHLIKELQINYSVNLVISSSWRINMPETIQTLQNNGVYFPPTPVTSTIKETFENSRGNEIATYLKQVNETSNFVIIDDEWFDFKDKFYRKNIIKTDFYKDGLTKKQVQEFLQYIENKLEQEQKQ